MSKRPAASNGTLSEAFEDLHAEYYRSLKGAPGFEIHDDLDVIWKVTPGAAWSNCGVRLRLSSEYCDKRIKQMLVRYRDNGRGAGFWVSPSATPENLEDHLKMHGLHCRKYFPAMCFETDRRLKKVTSTLKITIEPLRDLDIFDEHPHPSIGPITTPIRRLNIACQKYLMGQVSQATTFFVAMFDGKPIGIATLFIGSGFAGLFDLGVLAEYRNQGVGSVLVRHASAFARDRGARGVGLIATNDGFGVYERIGFREIAKFGYWYAARP